MPTSKKISYVTAREQEGISRAVLSWLKKHNPDIEFEYLPPERSGMSLTTIQGAYKTAQYMGYNDFYEDYKLSDYKYADDEEIGEWAKEAVYQMNKAEIMTGMGDDMFSPKSNYTNEQSISTIMRLYDLQNKPKSTPTPTLAPIPEPTEVPTTEETDIPETDGGETTVQEN